MLCQLSYRGSEAAVIVAMRRRLPRRSGRRGAETSGVRDLAMIGFLLVWFLTFATALF